MLLLGYPWAYTRHWRLVSSQSSKKPAKSGCHCILSGIVVPPVVCFKHISMDCTILGLGIQMINWDLHSPSPSDQKLFQTLHAKLCRDTVVLVDSLDLLKCTVPCQAEARAVWEKGVPSVTGRFYVTISKGSPSLLSGVLHDVEVSNVFRD